MNVSLGNLQPGKWRYLSAEEINTIQRLVENSSKTEEASYLPEGKRNKR